MKESEAFNELCGAQVMARCRPHIMTPMCLLHSHSLVMPNTKLSLGSRRRKASNSYLDHIMQISDSLSTYQQAVSSAPAWDLNLLRKCRSHGKLLNFHEDKQDNGICSANWISRTVWLLAEFVASAVFFQGNRNHCIFPIISSCWCGKETRTNRTSMEVYDVLRK